MKPVSAHIWKNFCMTERLSLPEVVASPAWLEQVNLRHAHAEDLPALEWEGEYAHFRRMYREVFERARRGHALMWLADLPGAGLLGQAFVQLFLDGPAGWRAGRRHAYVHGFRVRSELRGHGLGSHLMDCVEQDLINRNLEIVTLNVVETNHGARRFYERRGYRVVAEDPGQWSYVDHHGITRHVNEPGWRMAKRLAR